MNSQNAVTFYKYNAFGEVAEKTRYANPVTLGDSSVTNLPNLVKPSKYDRIEAYEYDRDGKLIETSQPAIRSYNAKTNKYSLELKPTTQTTYNAFGEPIKVASKINETEWANTFYYYDNDGQKTAQIDAEHYLTTYSYNALGQLEETTEWTTASTQHDTSAYTEPTKNTKDRTVSFTYDSLGQLKTKTLKKVGVSSKDKTGKYTTSYKDLTTKYSYDALGHLISTTDPQGNTSYCYYNNLGQLIAKVAPKTQDGRAATTYAYDALGNLVETRIYAAGAKEADESHYILMMLPPRIK